MVKKKVDYTKVNAMGFEPIIKYRNKEYKLLNTGESVSSNKKQLQDYLARMIKQASLGGPRKDSVFAKEIDDYKKAIMRVNVFGTRYAIYVPR